MFGPLLRSAADGVERVLGGATSVRRRLERADIDKTVHEFRVEQVLWGLVGFAVAATYGVLKAVAGSGGALSSLILCAVAFSIGVIARDNYLTSQVKNRERRHPRGVPSHRGAARAGGGRRRGPVAALDRVVRRSGGELSRDLAKVLAAIRTGEPVGAAFDQWAATTGLPLVARSPRASLSPSNAGPRLPTYCTPRPPTYAKPADAS